MRHKNYFFSSVMINAHGFAMMQVLITILVLSFGLIGLVTLQANSYRNTHSAYLRSIATLQAYDIADRIRSNQNGVTAGVYDSITGIPSDPGCISLNCSISQLAQYDARQWNTDNGRLLPSGQGTVTRSGNTFLIRVMWDDERRGVSGTNCSNSASDLKCFSVVVQS